jgi:hypothetical protein
MLNVYAWYRLQRNVYGVPLRLDKWCEKTNETFQAAQML